ncbi:hypothetical protein [Nocardia yunnanensis]|uniref:hypothetical protein n=1 Tax=Nocardia yunnanensis TaxID=2382165 RepID=UPI0013C4873D|nr:hypothetical protein [Nocardia yunnanensis]
MDKVRIFPVHTVVDGGTLVFQHQDQSEVHDDVAPYQPPDSRRDPREVIIMETIILAAAWAAIVAIRALPEIIRSRRTCVSVMVTPTAEGMHEVAITATNVEDAVRVVREALATRPEQERRAFRTGTGTRPRRGCGNDCLLSNPDPTLAA